MTSAAAHALNGNNLKVNQVEIDELSFGSREWCESRFGLIPGTQNIDWYELFRLEEHHP